jgi:hypothetical protein
MLCVSDRELGALGAPASPPRPSRIPCPVSVAGLGPQRTPIKADVFAGGTDIVEGGVGRMTACKFLFDNDGLRQKAAP